MRAIVPSLLLAPMLALAAMPARAQTASQVQKPPYQVQNRKLPAHGDNNEPTLAPLKAPQRQTLEQRFERANSTHDGKLTMAQAQKYMPDVAQHFQQIDTDHNGTVSLGEIVAWNRSHPQQVIRADRGPNVGGIGAQKLSNKGSGQPPAQ